MRFPGQVSKRAAGRGEKVVVKQVFQGLAHGRSVEVRCERRESASQKRLRKLESRSCGLQWWCGVQKELGKCLSECKICCFSGESVRKVR